MINYYENNKEYYKQKAREYYQANRDKILAYEKQRAVKRKNTDFERRKRCKQLWIEFFSEHFELKCTKCGYNSCLAALDFHHKHGDKDFTISREICNRKRTKEREERVLKELSKCILLCANCHREWHYLNGGMSYVPNSMSDKQSETEG